MHAPVEHNKAVVRGLVEEVMNTAVASTSSDALYTPELAPQMRRWVAPFRESLPDGHMEVVKLVAEADTVAARFVCSGTHLGRCAATSPADASASARSTSSSSPREASPARGASRTTAGA